VSGVSPDPGSSIADQYGESYFAEGLGEPYTRANPTWARFFGGIADFIVAEFSLRTVLDVGCAIGFLVEALRDRGVDARGIDISDYAIAQVPEALKAYCTLGSVTDELDGRYDLITCIEVLEHLSPEGAEEAVENLARHTDRILFSSTPYDHAEPTHASVRPPDAWVRLFAAHGFLPAPVLGTLAISPQAMVLERGGPDPAERLAEYETLRCEIARELSERTRAVESLEADLWQAGAAPAHAALAIEQVPDDAKRTAAARALENRLRWAEIETRRHASRARELEAQLEEVLSTTWWRLGAPIRDAVTVIRVRVPRALGALARNAGGDAATAVRARRLATRAGRLLPPAARRAVRARFPATVERLTTFPPTAVGARQVEELVSARLPLLRPLSVFPVPGDGKLHLTVLTDSLRPNSLFGGVGTSMILAAMLARRAGASLRVVTRGDPPDPSNFGMVLRAHEVEWSENVEFAYAPIDPGGAAFPWRQGEIFLTTSWWSTWAALRSVDPSRIVYLLQEDERLFYPAGDEQVACGEVLADSRIRFAVNTTMLYDYLVGEGFENIAASGTSFEPAFPESIYFRAPDRGVGKRGFFFYARPNNVRNLFFRGLEAVKEAILRGIIDADGWEVHFVGSAIPPVILPRGVRPAVSEHLPWAEYAALLRRVDVGLSLMSSPHPSYPPLDLAACGAVAVTNRFGVKESLDRYSANIICTEVSRDALVAGIAAAAALAADEPRRARNYADQRLSRSWEASLEPLIDHLASTL
jgi:SAM-dependent methyltransferase